MNLKNHLSVVMFLVLLVAIALFPSLPSLAAETAGYEVVPCSVDAYVISHDPAGVKVRSGPGEEYPVTAKLSTDPDIPSDLFITGSTGEWMRINQENYSGSEAAKETIGWVYGPSLGLRAWPGGPGNKENTGLVPLYEEANTKSPILVRLPRDAEAAVVGCQGEWVEVNYKGIKGWLAPGTYCGASVTNCI